MSEGLYFETIDRASGNKVQYVTVGTCAMKHDGNKPYIKMIATTGFGKMMTLHPDHFARVRAGRDSLIRPVINGIVQPYVEQEDRIAAAETVYTPAAVSTAPAKQGSKKERAIAIYNEMGGDKKATIARFVNELSMSNAGAQTYFYNCKKGI